MRLLTLLFLLCALCSGASAEQGSRALAAELVQVASKALGVHGVDWRLHNAWRANLERRWRALQLGFQQLRKSEKILKSEEGQPAVEQYLLKVVYPLWSRFESRIALAEALYATLSVAERLSERIDPGVVDAVDVARSQWRKVDTSRGSVSLIQDEGGEFIRVVRNFAQWQWQIASVTQSLLKGGERQIMQAFEQAKSLSGANNPFVDLTTNELIAREEAQPLFIRLLARQQRIAVESLPAAIYASDIIEKPAPCPCTLRR